MSDSTVGVRLYNSTVEELHSWRARALAAERELADLRRSRARQLRVLELRRAGWKLSSIAFELHMSKEWASRICCNNGLRARHPKKRKPATA